MTWVDAFAIDDDDDDEGHDPRALCATCRHPFEVHVANLRAPVCKTCKNGPPPGCFDAWHAFEP